MKDDSLYLIHITECLGRIESYTRSGRTGFMRSTMAQDAVIRNLEVIGEAANQVPQDFRDRHPELPWRRIAGFRDVLIHAYDRVRLDEVWSIIEKDLPDLKRKIEAMLQELEEQP